MNKGVVKSAIILHVFLVLLSLSPIYVVTIVFYNYELFIASELISVSLNLTDITCKLIIVNITSNFLIVIELVVLHLQTVYHT